MNNQRNRYFDFLRGIAIMMVIAIHTFPPLEDTESLNSILIISLRQFCNCAVPLFLAISGYFIAKKDLSTSVLRVRFWKKQISVVYVPCLIWSLGWFILDIYKSDASNIWYSLLMLFICGYSVYYFIALIIQLYFIVPWLSRVCSRGRVIISGLVSAISIVIVTYMLQIEGKSFPLVMYAGPFFLWLVFFVLGVYLSNHSRDYSLLPSILIMIIGLIASVLESLFYFPIHGGGLGIKLSSFVFSFGAIIFLFSTRIERMFSENMISRIILYIGEISFAVYLIHIYVSFAIGHTGIDSWFISWLLTLLVTVAIIAVAKRLLPVSIHKYFGLR